MFLTDPLVRRPGHRTAPARLRVLEEATFIPDPGPRILLVAQDDAHRRDSPAAPLGPAPSRLPRKRNALAIQGVGDRLQAPTVRIVLKDAPHEGRFARLYLEAGGRGIADRATSFARRNGPIAEDTTSRAPATGHATGEA